ncbi:unnamed protein product [Hapterophycus canaliculatus]
MTHVAEEGNRRKGGMSGAEINQSVLDVESWFKKHARDCLEHAEGVRESDLQALEKAVDATIPEELRSIMSIQDGQLWFSEKQALTCEAMTKTALEMEGRMPGWRAGLVPFAKDVDESFLVTDTHARGCPVAEWDAEDGEGVTAGKTFSLFLEGFRNELLSGQCEYVEGLGVVQKIAKSKSASSSPSRGRSSRK